MPGPLDFLAPYGNPMSPGQPVGSGGGFNPPSPPGDGGGFDWKRLIAPALGALGSGLVAGKEGIGSFAGGFADAMHGDIQRRRQQQFETDRAIGDSAHKMWQELQGVDLSMLPPNLSHLATEKQAFDQKYAQAIAKDGINAKEAQELLALGSVIKGAMPEVKRFGAEAEKASPYTSGIASGQMEPPPGAEGIAEMGLPDEMQSRLAGIEAMRGADLTRQQYETPQKTEYGLMTPRDMLAQRGQDARVKAQAAALKATEDERYRRDTDRDAALQAQIAHWGSQAAQSGAKPMKVVRRNPETGVNEVVMINPTTGDLVSTIGEAPLSATVSNRVDTANSLINTGDKIKAFLQDPKLSSQLGVVMGRYNDFNEFIGNPPPEFAKFAGEIHSLALASGSMHGMRGAELARDIEARFKGKHTPEAIAATIDGMMTFPREFLNTTTGGNNPWDLTMKPPSGGTALAVPPGMKLQRNKRTGETRLVPIQ